MFEVAERERADLERQLGPPPAPRGPPFGGKVAKVSWWGEPKWGRKRTGSHQFGEDLVFVKQEGEVTVVAVMDGHGPAAGTFVRRMADVLRELLEREWSRLTVAGHEELLREVFRELDERLCAAFPLDGGSTLTVVVVWTGEEETTVACANVGDSEAVLVQDGSARLLSTDHTWENPQEYAAYLERARRRGVRPLPACYGPRQVRSVPVYEEGSAEVSEDNARKVFRKMAEEHRCVGGNQSLRKMLRVVDGQTVPMEGYLHTNWGATVDNVQISRSIGDASQKGTVLRSDPSMSCVRVGGEEVFVVLYSDGVGDLLYVCEWPELVRSPDLFETLSARKPYAIWDDLSLVVVSFCSR